MKSINNRIDKKFILDNVDQVKIFATYLDISEYDIEECIETGKLMPSPVRGNDNHASAGFKYNNRNVLKLRDFGGFFWGDCFDAVAYVLSRKETNINIANKDDFKYVLKHIAETFNIVNGVDKKDNIKELAFKAKHTKKIISFNVRDWDFNDEKIWIKRYHGLFTFDYLVKKHVYPVETFWIDYYSQPEPKYYYTRKDPCYAIYLGTDGKGIPNIRLYFPNRKNDPYNPKFISNNNSFQNILHTKDEYDFIVLIKSYKDAIAMEKLFDITYFTGNYSVWFLAYPTESFILNQHIITWLLSKLKVKSTSRILNFTDFDRAGRKNAYYGSNEFDVPYVFLTNGEFGLPNHGVKDITDFIEKYGISATQTIINEFIKYYERYIEIESEENSENPYF